MAQATVERLAGEIKMLTLQEQEQLRILLDYEVPQAREETLSQQQRLLERLRAKGIIGDITTALN